MAYRTESDVIGKVRVPSDAYYGSFTARAIGNFPVSGIRFRHELISALALVKRSAALANFKAGALDGRISRAIVRACDEVIAGRFPDQFPVDVFQAGAGTSTNMNVNEVVANRAMEMLGGRKGHYSMVHPNDHVNMSQSTNDAFHSAVHMSVYAGAAKGLVPKLRRLSAALARKAKEFDGVYKVGRTHLQDAVPMTLGQEFTAHMQSIESAAARIMLASDELLELPLGGTVVGTGINAAPGFGERAVAGIRSYTGVKFRASKRTFYVIQDQTAEASVSASLKVAAIAVCKLSNDLRLLSSGPRTGLSDIILPEVQPGSSIMPGKINPSMPEMANMVCFDVIGSDVAVSEAAMGGQLQLNVFMPVIAFRLLHSAAIMGNASVLLADKCVRGIRANTALLESRMRNNLALATALSPQIGYRKASEIARKAHRRGKSIYDVCIEEGLFTEKELERLLDPEALAGAGRA